MIVDDGESVAASNLEVGSTMSPYKIPISVKAFRNDWSGQGPCHHCPGGVERILSKVEKVGYIFNMQVEKFCLEENYK